MTILKAIKFVTEVLLSVGMIAIPALIVNAGHNMTAIGLCCIYIPLGILLAILLLTDVHAVKKEECEKELSDARMAEKLRREDTKESSHEIKKIEYRRSDNERCDGHL